MAERMRARVIRVMVDRHGGSLAAAAAVDDLVLQVNDAGDFTAPGTLQVDDDAGTLLDFTAVALVEDVDPTDLTSHDTITLAAPLTVAIPVGTSLWVYEAPSDSDDADDPRVAEVFASCIPQDDEDAPETGEPIRALVPREFQDDLPAGDRPAPGVPVVLEWDEEEEGWEVARIRGKGSRAIHFEHAEPAYTPTDLELTAGTFTRQLLHRNIAAEHGLFTTINGVAIGSEWWSLDAKAGKVTVTIPDWVADAPADFREFGWPMYAYRRGLAQEGPTILLDEHYEDYALGSGVGYFPHRGYDYTIFITGIVEDDPDQGHVLAPSMPADAGWAYQYVQYQRFDPEGTNPIMTPLPTGVASAKICRKATANPDLSGDAHDIGAWPLVVWAPNGSDASPTDGSPAGFDVWCRIQIPLGTEGRVLRFINDACSDVTDNFTHFDTDPFIEDDVWYEVKIEWAADGSMVYTVHQGATELYRWETSYIPTRTPVDAARMGGDAQAFYTGAAYYTLTDDAYFATWSL